MVNYTLSLKENKILGDNFGNVEWSAKHSG